MDLETTFFECLKFSQGISDVDDDGRSCHCIIYVLVPSPQVHLVSFRLRDAHSRELVPNAICLHVGARTLSPIWPFVAKSTEMLSELEVHFTYGYTCMKT